MGMLYGVIGMICLIAGYWVDNTYTYGDGRWLIAASMLPGIVFGIWSAVSVEIGEYIELNSIDVDRCSVFSIHIESFFVRRSEN
mmetsp:Transcript_24343/g.26155  ORF Transcript_24343/g.26155 Transcript_24343/m.26155 type:complete len:84 (+) Transcript_24343:1010-1261(+)